MEANVNCNLIYVMVYKMKKTGISMRLIDESVFKAYVVEVHAYTGDVTFATTVDADTPVYLWQY